MISKWAIDQICGVLLILLPAVLITSIATGSKFETYEKTAMRSLQTIADNQALFAISTIFLFITGLVGISLAAALYLSFRDHERTLALFGAVWVLGMGVTLVVGAMGGWTLTEIADEFEKASGGNASGIATSARPMQHLYEGSGLLGLATFFPLGLMAFGALVIRSRAVPRVLGWMALPTGVLIPAIWVGLWLVGMVGMLLAAIWLVLLGVWMVVSGTREAEPVAPVGYEPRVESAPAAGDA